METSLLPDIDLPFEHAGDIAFAPLIIFLGVRVPADVLEHFTVFRGEHQVERIISDTPRRIITVWLGKDWMIGGEFTSRTAAQSDQFYPATIHWRIDTDQVGWARVSYLDPIDVRAIENRLEMATTGEIVFLVHAPGARIEQIKYDTWHLKALTVRVDTNAAEISVHPRADCFEIRYTVAGSQPIECILKCEKENS